MNRFRLSPALLLVLAPLAGTAYAADRRVDSGNFAQRKCRGLCVVGQPRDAVALEGVRVTGEWPSYTNSVQTRDFPLGTNVQTATKRHRLLLKHPDGSIVDARIVRTLKSEQDEDERD
jgi:hypothetical protein